MDWNFCLVFFLKVLLLLEAQGRPLEGDNTLNLNGYKSSSALWDRAEQSNPRFTNDRRVRLVEDETVPIPSFRHRRLPTTSSWNPVPEQRVISTREFQQDSEDGLTNLPLTNNDESAETRKQTGNDLPFESDSESDQFPEEARNKRRCSKSTDSPAATDVTTDNYDELFAEFAQSVTNTDKQRSGIRSHGPNKHNPKFSSYAKPPRYESLPKSTRLVYLGPSTSGGGSSQEGFASNEFITFPDNPKDTDLAWQSLQTALDDKKCPPGHRRVSNGECKKTFQM